MKTNDFNIILQQLQNSEPKDFVLTHMIRIVTEDNIKRLAKFISDRKLLVDYFAAETTNRRAISVFLNRIIPIMYEEEEIEQYFLELLIQLHGNEDNWHYVKKDPLFKKLTGITFANFEKRNLYLAIVYNRVYDEKFVHNYLYPQSFINHGLSLIERNEPLAENYMIFQAKYQRYEDDSYIKVMHRFFVSRIGEDAFLKYLQNLAARFDDTLEIHDRNTYTNDRFLDYMFGYHWSLSMHIRDAHRKDSQSRLAIEKMVLRAVVPYTIVNYPSKHQRESVYNTLELSESEITVLEHKWTLSDRQAYLPKAVVTEYKETDKLRFGNTYQDLFNLIDRAISELAKNRSVSLSKTNIIEKCRTLCDGTLYSDLMYARRTSAIWVRLVTYIDQKTGEANDLFFKTNRKEFQNDTWVLYYRMGDHYRSATLSFEGLKQSMLKSRYKEYCQHEIVQSNYSYNTLKKVKAAIESIGYLIDKLSLTTVDDVLEYHVLAVLRYYETERKHKPCTLMEDLGGMRSFFQYCADKYHTSEPTLNIKLNNLKEYRGSTPVIPDDILVYIDNHLNDIKQVDCMLAYRIMMETGWRFSDIRKILPEDITLSDDGTYASISTISPKTKKARTKRLLGAEISDVLTVPLFEDIQKYLQDTAPIRETYGITTLFYSIVNSRISKFRPDSLNRALNNMLVHNGIRSVNEDYLNFSAMQTRKTVASALISAGAPIASVQKKLGHVSPQTAERYYAEANKKKLAELNDEFYQKKFNIYMDADKLRLFTEEERRLLYVDFCLSRRTVELGMCSKHPSEGRCASIGHTSCASCPKLCTGRRWLDRWEKLAADAAEVLQMFRKKYEENGISEEEYSSYIEYKQEHTAYKRYLSVIDTIKNGG